MSKDLQILKEKILQFRNDRDWGQFHTLKDLIISLNLEASELLEITQWKNEEAVEEKLGDPDFLEELKDECADIFIYLLLISEKADIDLAEEVLKKIKLNEKRYPVKKSYGSSKKYNKLFD